MNLTTAILIGLKEMWAHKFRSLLTMLGIVLGVASLVAMAAIVKGMENGMKESMIAMGGADKVLLRDEDVPTYQENMKDQAPGKTIYDVQALRASAPLIHLVSPEIGLRAIVSREGKQTIPSETIGAWPAALPMNLHEMDQGRFFTDLDEELANSVCVIGTGIRDALFGSPEETGHEINPVGHQILINEQPFTVVGLLKHYEGEQNRKMREINKRQEKASTGPARERGWRRRYWDAFWRKNNTLYMPLNTAWIKFRAGATTNGVPDPTLSDVDIKVASLEKMELALQQARNILMLTHNGVENFTFRTQENDLDEINKRIRNARISGGVIAALSLLVGGIGIMNIMLASINERIREIGTCMAIGASGRAIFGQILIESVTLALLGALSGVAASFGLVDLIVLVSPAQNSPQVTPLSLVVAVGFSAFVGLAAGLFPAVKASRLNPIQALRCE